MELSDWLELVADAARELAETALGTVQVAFVPAPPGALSPEQVHGVYLPMFSGSLALQLALLAEPPVCLKLARRFLGLPPADELEAEGLDVLGAFGNLIVGTLETRLGRRCDLRLGIPLALRGHAFALGGAASLEGMLVIDGDPLHIVLCGARNGASSGRS